MNPERWKLVDSLLHQALERPAEEREEFLRRACSGDRDLESEVRSLLASRQRAGSFLESPAIELAAQDLTSEITSTTEELTDFPAGSTVSHYSILERLGSGGMGVVYKAKDNVLGRFVALKFLPEEFSKDPQRLERFRREARAAAALNHPNICTVHEIGEHEGRPFMVMELLEGQTLKDCFREKHLKATEMLDLAAQIADALDVAHEQGIIHRDIKPANILITSHHQAKILDFGLAKLIQRDALDTDISTRDTAGYVDQSLTCAGQLLGTVDYMSPEQAKGQPVDRRADIWAFGCVLFEMLSGRKPFEAKTVSEVLAVVIGKEPDWDVLPETISPSIKKLIQRCLEKEPERRYQKAGELREVLDAVKAGTASARVGLRYRLRRHRWLLLTAAVIILLVILMGLSTTDLRERLWGGSPRIQSLAVLPLANLSDDKEQEYFADGMTAELITNLAKISALKVISRTSVMQYKGTRKTLPQIAKELNVDALIEGSVVREGGQARITAQLIQASTDQLLWAESYQRDLRGVLTLQGEIANAIADKVRVAVTPAERTLLASTRLVNPEAYNAYLKGMQHWYNVTPQEVDTALQYFELALQKDPNSARAYVGICMVWQARSQMGISPPAEAIPKAREAALKAIALDNALAEAHHALATVKGNAEYDWAGAEAEFKRAIELNPNYADSRRGYSHMLMWLRRPEEALAQIQRALELDPRNPMTRAFYAVDLYMVRRYDEAIVEFRKALAISPETPFALWMLSATFFQKGLYAASLAEIKAYYAGDRELQEALAKGYAQSGYRGAMRMVANTLAARAPKTYVLPADVAGLYMWAGEKAEALKWLEKGLEVRDPNMFYIGVDPCYTTLGNEPRFRDLLRRMNLPH